MGTDVKIGLMVGLALLVVVILYFGAKSDDQAELAQPDKPAVTTRPATDTGGITRTHPRNGARQSILGRGTDC